MNAPLLFDWRRDEARRASRRRQQARQRAQERQSAYGCHNRVGRRYRPAACLGSRAGIHASACCACGYCGDRRCGIHGGGFHRYVLIGVAQWQSVRIPIRLAGRRSTGRTTVRAADEPVGTRSSWSESVAEQGTVILSPQAGTVSFAGKVAGKDVVSVRHRGGVTSTFEPAVTELSVGDTISRRQPVGIVEGSSDHCEDRCLHWGLKRGTADYLDPQQYAGSRKIVLKPS